MEPITSTERGSEEDQMTGGKWLAMDRGAIDPPSEQLERFTAQPDEPVPTATVQLIDLAMVHMDDYVKARFQRWYESLSRRAAEQQVT